MRRTLATVAAASLLALAACSTSSDGDGGASGGSTTADVAADAPAPAAEQAQRSALDSASMDLSDGDAFAADAASTAEEAAEPEATERSVISTGSVALRSDDVGQALFDVRKVVDAAGGEVEQEKTETDKTGAELRSRLVLRIPTARFDATMTDLKAAADLVSASANSEDVTTQVLDVDIRVQVQRRSIQRIALLLDRAESIRDIVAIEAQLSQRQADLAALEKKQDYLADQTAMSTIAVSVERTPKAAPPEKKDDEDAGFLTGLDAGWDALKTFAVGLATFLGAVLPWTLVLLVVGIPGWPLVRRLRRRQAASTAASA